MSQAAWGVARQLAGVELQHPVLHVPFVPLDDENGPRAVAEAHAELERTWLVHNRRISADFIEVLRLLAASPREVHGWIGLHNRTEIGVVAATDGMLAVRVVSDPDGLRMTPISPDKLVESAVDLVPRAPASKQRSATIPREAYERDSEADQQGSGYMVRMTPGSTAGRDVAAFRALVAGPRRGGGRFYAAARDRMGRRRKSDKPLTYLDLESGRTMFREQLNSGGEPWLIATPATRAVLAAQLGSMLNQVSIAG